MQSNDKALERIDAQQFRKVWCTTTNWNAHRVFS